MQKGKEPGEREGNNGLQVWVQAFFLKKTTMNLQCSFSTK
jgi:hypothetical protein